MPKAINLQVVRVLRVRASIAIMQSIQYEYPLQISVLPIHGSSAMLPVRRIYCVGRNYIDHIREMKEADEREPPFFFQKPTTQSSRAVRRFLTRPIHKTSNLKLNLSWRFPVAGSTSTPPELATTFWVTRLASNSRGVIASARCMRKCFHGNAESLSTIRLLVERCDGPATLDIHRQALLFSQ